MQNLNERGAAYIPIAEARGITPHSDKGGIRVVYAKKTDGDGNVLSLYTYNFDPDFGGDGSMSIITK